MQLRRTTSALFGSLALLGLSSAASAAAITFGAAQNDTADTDVSTTGTLVAAYSVSGPAVTVNTVPFAAFPVSGASATNGNTTVATSTGTITNPGSAYGTPSSSSMSTNYKSILSAGSFEDFAPSPTFTITFSGLTLGQQYKVQLWVNDSRGPAAGGFRTGTLSGPGASNSVTLAYDVGNVSNGAGQYALGTFTADAASQTVTFTGTSSQNDTQINAFQLRSIPEPTSLGLLGVGGLGLLARRRRA